MARSRKPPSVPAAGDDMQQDPRAEEQRFHLGSLPYNERQKVLEAFMLELEKFLSSEMSREELFKSVSERLQKDHRINVTKIDSRQFDNFVRGLYAENYFRFQHKRNFALESKLANKEGYGEMRVKVSAGISDEFFTETAAFELIDCLRKIAINKKAESDDPVIRIGIVSGRTCGSVIRKLTDIEDWSTYFGTILRDMPKIQVFALNVCLTAAPFLPNNASILVYIFAEAINKEAKENKAEAWGLSAPLFVYTRQLEEIDLAPQTFEVVQYTEPYRVLSRLDPEYVKQCGTITRTTTMLDIVLTGVGDKPFPRGNQDSPTVSDTGPHSIFYALANGFRLPMRRIVETHRIVGDVAFTPISSDGEPVCLFRTLPEDGIPDDNEACMFYTAIQLHVLEEMARDPKKSVILVARGRDKVPAVYASVCGTHRYASSLVVDEVTGQYLVNF